MSTGLFGADITIPENVKSIIEKPDEYLSLRRTFRRGEDMFLFSSSWGKLDMVLDVLHEKNQLDHEIWSFVDRLWNRSESNKETVYPSTLADAYRAIRTSPYLSLLILKTSHPALESKDNDDYLLKNKRIC